MRFANTSASLMMHCFAELAKIFVLFAPKSQRAYSLSVRALFIKKLIEAQTC